MAREIILSLVLACIVCAGLVKCKPKNVLMIVVDDLRPQLAYAYKQHDTITPNIDKLVKGGLVFTRVSKFVYYMLRQFIKLSLIPFVVLCHHFLLIFSKALSVLFAPLGVLPVCCL